MDPFSFPPQIRQYFQEHPIETTDDEKGLKEIFSHESVKEAFINWAKEHQSIVEQTPRLYKALNVANVLDEPWEALAASIHSLFLRYQDDGSLTLINKVLLNEEDWLPEKIPDKYALTAFELFDTGIIDKTQLIKLLSTTFANDLMPLEKNKVLTLAIPFLDNLKYNDMVEVLSLCNHRGQTLMHSSKTFESAIPLLSKLKYSDLVKFLSISDYKNDTPLCHCLLKRKATPLRDQLKNTDLVKLLCEHNEPLHNIYFKNIFPFLLDKIDLEELIKILSVQDKRGLTPLHNLHLLIYVIPFLTTPELVLNLLTIKDNHGRIPLHNPTGFKEVLPLLMNLPGESLDQLFSIQDEKGNTILHTLFQNPEIYGESQAVLTKLNPKVFLIKNKEGLSVGEFIEWSKIHLSENWLVNDKITAGSKSISEADYQEKATELKENLDNLWNSFAFGEEYGTIPKEYLTIRISNENKNFTPEEIKAKLDAMLGKIINKTPWLGTPPSEDKEGLHLFYSQMLMNFEEVISALANEDSPEKKAGPLISIAKTELEERCAAAYQSEIEQAKMLLNSDKEGGSLEANFNKLACASLTDCIETIVRRNYSGNSHVFSQMLFSVGMAPSSDPLSPINVEDAQKAIKRVWTKDILASNLTEMFGRLDNEQLQDWFRASTPENFGQDFRIKQKEIEQAEEAIVNETIKQFKGLDKSIIADALKIFQSTQGADLGLNSRPRIYVSDTVFAKLNQATNLEEVKEAQALLSEENKIDRLKKFELLDQEDILKEIPSESLSKDEAKLLDSLIQERKALMLKSIGIEGEFKTLKLNAETKIKLGDLLKIKNPQITREELDAIVSVKKIFDNKIRALAEENEIDFSPSETGLPSRGVEYQRRVEYSSQFFTSKEDAIKLNRWGAIDILLHIGVLEK